MKKLFFLLFPFLLLSLGCAAGRYKSASLVSQIGQNELIKLWGDPIQKVNIGYTPDNKLVEIWEYYEKGFLFFKKDSDYILIFLEGKLYSWAVNDPTFVFRQLTELGVLKPDAGGYDQQYLQMLRTTAEQAEQTRKTLEIIRTYQNFNTTRQQLIEQQNQQQRFFLQQRQLNIPAPPKQPEKINK